RRRRRRSSRASKCCWPSWRQTSASTRQSSDRSRRQWRRAGGTGRPPCWRRSASPSIRAGRRGRWPASMVGAIFRSGPSARPNRPAGDTPVEPQEADARLLSLIGPNAEVRPQQRDYAAAVTHAFTPRDRVDAPKVAIAEAGTGVGKTLGYVAPASVWAEKNVG